MYYIELSQLEEMLGAEKSYGKKDYPTHRKDKENKPQRMGREPHPRPHTHRVRRLLFL
jgi:hypothetical protein